MHVHQILKSKGDGPVITITSKTSIAEAANVLAERRIGGLIVSSDGTQVEGILSERDIVRSLALRGAVCLEETVGDLMTRNPVCCSKDDTADSVLQKMTNGRFRHMPVTEDGALVGIITIGDAVKARLEELAMEAEALQGMIMGH
ncbi:CBS domain-containing protein [Lentibacter sp. XHP0401]|jgi:CBS domain-containing protein|uniref:CBS domain-containing protein n=1 Tax=Lentibacter sp. XHP0401 TaxID=2984334 RepID=UPI0021E96E70|nr:CBS domain-containing protein [Lentibacter sp. XHP0401]MCV2891941.1 CBS domain-containing protein [Lentibacter sp. XHP0401]